MQLLPDVRPNSAPDRQADLASAKQLVAEIEEEEQDRAERRAEISTTLTSGA
jgi:hypothetical protein